MKENNNTMLFRKNNKKYIEIDLDKNPRLFIKEGGDDRLSLSILKNISDKFDEDVKIYSISKFKYENRSNLSNINDIYDLMKELKIEAGLIGRKLIRARCKSIQEYNKKYPDLKINQNIVYIDNTSEIIRDIRPLRNYKLDEIRRIIKYLIENTRIKFIIDVNNHETIDKYIYEFIRETFLFIIQF